MRSAVAVQTTPTLAAAADKQRDWIILQNTSDSVIYLDVTGDGSSPVTSSNGLKLAAGSLVTLTGGPANNAITAIHADTGDKSLVVQGGGAQ